MMSRELTMTTKIKNCGLSTSASILRAVETGASFAGFVHYEKSPRHVSLEAMAKLVTVARPKLKTVAVLVDPSDELLARIANDVKPHYFQVHNVLSPVRVAEITQKFGLPVITAISVRDRNDLGYASMLEAPSAHLLFDAKEPGSGQAFDWTMLHGVKMQKPWFLAGGLNAENVGDAIRISHAPMVDVSSGLEEKAGVKSLEKIAAFNKAVLHSAHA